jgi:hypothetical protein
VAVGQLAIHKVAAQIAGEGARATHSFRATFMPKGKGYQHFVDSLYFMPATTGVYPERSRRQQSGIKGSLNPRATRLDLVLLHRQLRAYE